MAKYSTRRRRRKPKRVMPTKSQLKRAIQKVAGVERKSVDEIIAQNGVFTNMSDNGFLVLLNPLPQGTKNAQRIGDKVTLETLRITGTISVDWHPDTGSMHDTFSRTARLLVIQDRVPNGSFPIKASIFRWLTALTSGSNWFTQPNVQETARFRVLKEKTFNFNPDMRSVGHNANANTLGYSKSFYVDLFCKLKGVSKYTGATGSIAEISSNAIYFLVLTDKEDATLTAEHGNLNVDMMSRIRYTDS